MDLTTSSFDYPCRYNETMQYYATSDAHSKVCQKKNNANYPETHFLLVYDLAIPSKHLASVMRQTFKK